MSEPRSALGDLAIRVDARARPFHERLDLSVQIDDDLILSARATSSDVKDSDEASFHDLEFGLQLPHVLGDDESDAVPDAESMSKTESGALAVRTNVAWSKDYSLVPGEVLHGHDRHLFDRRSIDKRRATKEQIQEHLYYQPCAGCGRASSDADCRCLSGQTTQ